MKVAVAWAGVADRCSLSRWHHPADHRVRCRPGARTLTSLPGRSQIAPGVLRGGPRSSATERQARTVPVAGPAARAADLLSAAASSGGVGARVWVAHPPTHPSVRGRVRSGKRCSIRSLNQAQKSHRIRLDPEEAAPRSAACSFMAGWPRQGTKDLLALHVLICERTPCYRLDFSPDGSAPAAAGLRPMP